MSPGVVNQFQELRGGTSTARIFKLFEEHISTGNEITNLDKIRVVILSSSILCNDPLVYANAEGSIKQEMSEISKFLEQVTGNRYLCEKLDRALHDVQTFMTSHNAHIVHFCGYINKDGIRPEETLPRTLSELFGVLGKNIPLVVLIACHTDGQAKAIAESVDCVIGLSESVPKETANRVCESFYTAIAAGLSVPEAVRLGRNSLGSLSPPEDYFTFQSRKEIDVSKISFPKPSEKLSRIDELSKQISAIKAISELMIIICIRWVLHLIQTNFSSSISGISTGQTNSCKFLILASASSLRDLVITGCL
jgi:hypothetical protein